MGRITIADCSSVGRTKLLGKAESAPEVTTALPFSRLMDRQQHPASLGSRGRSGGRRDGDARRANRQFERGAVGDFVGRGAGGADVRRACALSAGPDEEQAAISLSDVIAEEPGGRTRF